jgi:DNA primase
MATKWIDFKELRERLDPAAVLAAYKVKVKVKGDQAQGYCPLPTHKAHEGRPKSPSFSVNLRRGIFNCFSCSASGNLLDLVCLLKGMNPENSADIRKTALLLDERFPASNAGQTSPPPASQKGNAGQKPDAGSERKIVVNAPLDFELKNIDPNHPYLLNRGFLREIIKNFGLGFCSKGLMKDRVVIPLRDHDGNLVGYAGRVVDDMLINDENPRYRFPSGREKNGVYYDFRKSLFLYNGCQFESDEPDMESVVVCESFTAVWWLTQWGFPRVVSIMGASCSPEQGELIAKIVVPNGLVTILTDGDEAGERCAHSIFSEVGSYRKVRWAKLGQGCQPTDCSGEELQAMLRL